MATETDLVFSSQANHNFSRILTDLKRANLSISNRLRSIRDDADFVKEVAETLGRPLVANERCGSWYIRPADKSGSAYFKSTDGHTGQWNFSSRRLNIHLLPIIGQHDGCIIVDSTRRGKQMPDALSKTVPIWCCVLNRVLFPEASAALLRLFTPPNVVSRSEHSQAEARIPEHVEALKALEIDVATLRRHVSKPLRPMWVTQESRLVPTGQIFEDYHPVICCTSSRRVPGGEMSEGGYIQGAGDDTENWALGLTAPIFWNNAEALLSTPESELPDLVRALVADQSAGPAQRAHVQVAPCIFVGQVGAVTQQPETCTIAFISKTIDQASWIQSPTMMEVGIGKAKLASRNLRTALESICNFVNAYLKRSTEEQTHPHILIVCESGKDLSIGVALALVCQLFDNEGNYKPRATDWSINKNIIKTKLGRIMMAFPEANPSRTTLQSVNSYLMG
ncbi:initiator tRNA phosphoribosyl transferase [Astrocystis sublimbata]|nr:initiator tRNA phosphoribosyl transferase [Astrocystis sublimbata]